MRLLGISTLAAGLAGCVYAPPYDYGFYEPAPAYAYAPPGYYGWPAHYGYAPRYYRGCPQPGYGEYYNCGAYATPGYGAPAYYGYRYGPW